MKKQSQLRIIWRSLCKNKMAIVSLAVLVLIVLCAIFANLLAPYDPNVQSIVERLTFPNSEHLMGTDNLGRDIFSRLLYGARVSLSVGVLATVVSMVLGTALGLIVGYFGGKVDEIIMRLLDIFMAIPSILLAIAIVATLGAGLTNACIAMVISGIPSFTRLVRSAVMMQRDKEYIEAASACNASNTRIDKYFELRALLPSLIVFLVDFSGSSVATFLATYALSIHLDSIGLFFTAQAAALALSRLVVGKLLRLVNASIMGPLTLAVMGASFVAMFFARSITAFVLIGIVYGFALGMQAPIYQTLCVKRSALNRRGIANATYQMARDLGNGLGAGLWGVLADAAGVRYIYLFAPIIVVVTIICSYAFLGNDLKEDA